MDNGQNFPFQIENSDQPAAEPLGNPTVRTQAEAECPGSYEKTVVLLRGRQVLDGLKEPRNIGSCKIHIACYDRTGTFIGTYNLEPGEKIDFLKFPSNTEVVRLGCEKGCSGTAILEYQTPYIS